MSGVDMPALPINADGLTTTGLTVEQLARIVALHAVLQHQPERQPEESAAIARRAVAALFDGDDAKRPWLSIFNATQDELAAERRKWWKPW